VDEVFPVHVYECHQTKMAVTLHVLKDARLSSDQIYELALLETWEFPVPFSWILVEECLFSSQFPSFLLRQFTALSQ
jgi:hypothetical protein